MRDYLTGVLLLGNPLLGWATALAAIAAALFAAALLRRIARGRLRQISTRSRNRIDDALLHALDGTRLWLLLLVVTHIALNPLLLPPRIDAATRIVALVALVLQLGAWLTRLLDFAMDQAQRRAMATDASTATSLFAIKHAGRLLLWSLLLLLLLDNLGIDVTALVAGLGIGGIAVALAVQNILGDLFASMSILVDKPFVIGDFIVVDGFAGSVEHIGLKTTRLRSVDGEQLVFSNSDLLSSRVRNYKRMQQRRVMFTFGIALDAGSAALAQLPAQIRQIVEAQPDTRFDRAHLKAFGESSFQFEVAYHVLSADYTTYMDGQQAIHLALLDRLAGLGLRLAVPSQVVQVRPAGGDLPAAGTVPAGDPADRDSPPVAAPTGPSGSFHAGDRP